MTVLELERYYNEPITTIVLFLVLLGGYLLWVAFAVADPAWASSSAYRTILNALPPIARSALFGFLAFVMLFSAIILIRARSRRQILLSPRGVRSFTLLGYRNIPWTDFESIEFGGSEQRPFAMAHLKDPTLIQRVFAPYILINPQPNSFDVAVDYIANVFSGHLQSVGTDRSKMTLKFRRLFDVFERRRGNRGFS